MSALRDTAGSLGVLYYILFTLLICFIMVNVFLAVVFDACAMRLGVSAKFSQKMLAFFIQPP